MIKNFFRRLTFTALFLTLVTIGALQAQAPPFMSYQAEVRNTGNNLVTNQQVGMRISILQGDITGAVVYSETHTPTTNANGLVSIEVGNGVGLSGSFSGINWGTGTYYLKSEIDPTGGSSYTITATSRLLSVPYSFYSNNGVPSGGSSGQILTNCYGVPTWTTGGQCPGRISSLDCLNANSTGTLTQDIAASGVSSTINYTGGNGGPFDAQNVNSTGVSGLTASLSAGTFASGSGTVTYTISGTPSGAGTATFTLTLGGQSCNLALAVNLPVGIVTALSCGSASNNGDLISGSAASSVSSTVSYTGGNGGTFDSQTVGSTGVTGLTASLAAGTFASGSGSVTFTISGTPSGVGIASFAITLGGQSCTLNRTVNLPVGSIGALSCGAATNTGDLNSGAAASNVSSTVSYTGGNGGTFDAQTINSTGVTGLTASLAAGTFASGSGSVTYTISGTPSGAGTSTFALTLGGQSCSLTRTVTVPAASISSLSCGSASNSGDLTSGTAASNASSVISYSGGNAGTYASQSISSTGVTGLTASLAAGTLASGSGTITYTLSGTPSSGGIATFAISLGGQICSLTRNVNAPSGTINALTCGTPTNTGSITAGVAVGSNVTTTISYTGGNGGTFTSQSFGSTGVSGLFANLASGTFASGSGNITFTITGTPSSYGTASFAITVGGRSCTFTRTVLAGASVPCTGMATVAFTYKGSTVTYGTVVGANDRCWMDRNLGANQVATGINDANAYGDLFQWGRGSDLHQTRNSATTSTLSAGDQPSNGNFIITSVAPFDWRSTQNNNLWQGVSGTNNPCPSGWRLPTDAELEAERVTWTSSNSAGAFASPLKWTANGARSVSGSVGNAGNIAYYWSSTPDGTRARYLLFSSTQSYLANRERSYGHAVRCIRN